MRELSTQHQQVDYQVSQYLTPENKFLRFKAGRLKLFISEWEKLTLDDSILDIVKHCHLEFGNDCVPSQTSLPYKI